MLALRSIFDKYCTMLIREISTPDRQRWPSRNKPELYQRGKFWIVRWYDPITKRARAQKFTDADIARAFHQRMRT